MLKTVFVKSVISQMIQNKLVTSLTRKAFPRQEEQQTFLAGQDHRTDYMYVAFSSGLSSYD